MSEVDAPCCLLEWDSEFFGFRIAQLAGETLSVETARRALEWSKQLGVRCLYFLADPRSAETAEIAHQFGFRMVDIRVQMSLKPTAQRPFTVPGFNLRSCRDSDIGVLQHIARDAHLDSRFFFDSHFPKGSAENLFARWIAADCGGRANMVLAVERDAIEVVGYVSCSLNPEFAAGRIGLVGVASAFRGMGLGRVLISGALDWFKSQTAEKVVIVTQVRNVAAQRLYEGAGFRTEDVKVWYHRWLLDPVCAKSDSVQ